MRHLPNSYHFIQHNGNNILRWCFRRTLVFYLFFTNISLFLSETGTKAAEEIRKKVEFGYDELNASQLRRSAAHQAWQEKGMETQEEQGSDLQPELNMNPKLINGLRHLTRKKHHFSTDDEYGDSSSSDSNNCDVCPTDGPFRKRKYHFYILHDVTNVGLYDFFGGSSNSKEVESSIPVASVPITPVASMPVIPLPPTTLPPSTSFPVITPIPGTTLPPTTLPPVTPIPGTTLPPTTLPPVTPVPGTTLPPTTLPPVTPIPGTTPAPATAAPVVRLASTATMMHSSVTEDSPAMGRSSFWQRISDFLSRFY